MRIDDKKLQEVYQLYQGEKNAQVERARDVKPADKVPVESRRIREGDRVELSKELRELERLREEVRQDEQLREKRVEEVKKQIEEGTYDMNARRTAYGMVRETIIDKIVK